MTISERHPRETDPELAAILDQLTVNDHAFVDPPDDLWSAIDAELSAEYTEPPSIAPVVALSAARRTRGYLAAAAALVVALVVGGVVLANAGETAAVVAEAAISSDGLPDAPQTLTGDAEIREGADGLELHVTFEAPADTDGYLELWLIDPNVEGMISLGPAVDGGVYSLPDGFAVTEYPIVDISIEPLDGVVTHSGHSVLRGQLF